MQGRSSRQSSSIITSRPRDTAGSVTPSWRSRGLGATGSSFTRTLVRARFGALGSVSSASASKAAPREATASEAAPGEAVAVAMSVVGAAGSVAESEGADRGVTARGEGRNMVLAVI